jgi:hypothetical protein
MLRVVKEVALAATPGRADTLELADVIKVLLALVESPLRREEARIGKIREWELRWVEKDTPGEVLALLELLTELLWLQVPRDIDPIVDGWLQRIPTTAAEHVRKTRERLKLQEALVSPESPQEDATIELRDASERLRHRMWKSFLWCEWDALNECREELVGDTPFDSPVARILYELLNRTRFECEYGDPQEIGLTRRLVHIYSSTASAFDEVRQKRCWLQLGKLWKRGDAASSSDQLARCLRLATWCELAALRSWDISSWLEATQQAADICLYACFHEPAGHRWAADAARLSVLSLSVGHRDDLLRKAVLLADRTNGDDRARLAKTVAATRPAEWYAAMNMFSWLSDAIPEAVLPEIVEWSKKVAAFPQRRLRGWKLFPLEFWGDIIGRVEDNEGLCKQLHPTIMKYASAPAIWASDKKGALRQYLKHAPEPLATEMIEAMFKTDGVDETDNGRRWGIVYEAAMEREELRTRFRDELAENARTLLDRYHLRFVENPEANPGPIDDPELRSWCCNQIEGHVDAVLARVSASMMSFGSRFNGAALRLVSWRSVDSDFIDKLVAGADHEWASVRDASELIHYLAHISLAADEEILNKLLGATVRWLSSPPRPRPSVRIRRAPQHDDTHGTESQADIEFALAHLAMRLVDMRPDDLGAQLGDWVATQALSVAPEALAAMLYVALRSGLAQEGSRGVVLVGVALGLLDRAANLSSSAKADHVRQCLHISAEVTEPSSEEWSVANGQNEEARELFLDGLARTVDKLHTFADPDVRLECARVLKNWKLSDSIPPGLSRCLERLRGDARARVRHELRGLS